MEIPGIKTLFDINLGLRNHEKVAVLYCSERGDVRRLLEAGLKEMGRGFISVPLDRGGGSWSTRAVEALEDPAYPVVVLTSVRSIWHHPARKRAKYQLGKRIVSIICEAGGFQAGYTSAEPAKMELLGTPLFELFKPGAHVHVSAPSGTDIEAVVKQPFLETGSYDLPSTGGNWPSGEVGFGPREGSVNGVIVYDLKFKHLGSMEKRKATVKVSRDRSVEFSGEGGYELKKLFLNRDRALFWVGEVALGLNSGFRRNPDDTIEVDPDPRTIVEEKALSTAHFGHGGNLSFGKRSGDHADGVVAAPTVTVNGVKVMIDGKFCTEPLSEGARAWLGEIGMLAGAASA